MMKMFKNHNTQKGFTLVELIVVIAVLGVLVGLAAPRIIGYVGEAKTNTDAANVKTVQNAADRIAARLGAYPSSGSTTLPDGKTFNAAVMEELGGNMPTMTVSSTAFYYHTSDGAVVATTTALSTGYFQITK